MGQDTNDIGFSRREFLKTAGLAGLAIAGGGVPMAMASGEPETAPQTNTVPRRVLGKTGVSVPILGLGGTMDTINNQLLIKQALKSGINYWDTARGYGNGLSEEGFGRYLARHPELRKDVFIVTKFVPNGAGI